MLAWQEDLDTGIETIDRQHRSLLDMANQLGSTRLLQPRVTVGGILDALRDHARSHLAHEEGLMAQADYAFTAAHRRVHDLFARRIDDYHLRFDAGEDIRDELRAMLVHWLDHHVRDDDRDAAAAIRRHLGVAPPIARSGWLRRTVHHLFH